MSDKPTLLERLMGAGKKKAEVNKGQLEEQVKAQLKGLVYDDELVAELLPVFIGLQGKEGFDKVVELLTTKEKQIEAIAGGDWFKKEKPADTETHEQGKEEASQSSANLVDDILKAQHEVK